MKLILFRRLNNNLLCAYACKLCVRSVLCVRTCTYECVFVVRTHNTHSVRTVRTLYVLCVCTISACTYACVRTLCVRTNTNAYVPCAYLQYGTCVDHLNVPKLFQRSAVHFSNVKVLITYRSPEYWVECSGNRVFYLRTINSTYRFLKGRVEATSLPHTPPSTNLKGKRYKAIKIILRCNLKRSVWYIVQESQTFPSRTYTLHLEGK